MYVSSDEEAPHDVDKGEDSSDGSHPVCRQVGDQAGEPVGPLAKQEHAPTGGHSSSGRRGHKTQYARAKFVKMYANHDNGKFLPQLLSPISSSVLSPEILLVKTISGRFSAGKNDARVDKV